MCSNNKIQETKSRVCTLSACFVGSEFDKALPHIQWGK